MRKYLLLLFALSLVLAASSAFATDFCVNPGFEVGADPAAPPWSLWGGTGGALPNPFVDVNNPSARVWSNFNSYSNVAAQNNMRWVWLAPGATYHVHAQYYVPLSQVPEGKTSRGGVHARFSDGTASIWVLDPSTDAAAITPNDAWVTIDHDWVYPGATFARMDYMPFCLYAWDGSTTSSSDTGGYFDNCQFSSAVDYISPTFSGTIKDFATSAGIPRAAVTIKDSSGLIVLTAVTNGSGVYSVAYTNLLPLGMPFTVDATANVYTSDGPQSFTITGANPAIPDVTMTKAPVTVHIYGTVTDSVTTLGIEGATVTAKLLSGLSTSTTTGPAGDYDIEVVPDSYTVTARKFPLTAPSQAAYTFDGYGTPIDVTLDFSLVNSLLIDISAAGLSVGPVSTWANSGVLGGSFGADTVLPGLPTLTLVGGKKAVYYNGSNCLKFSQTAPAAITGNSQWTVSSWLYCDTTNTDVNRTYLSWAQRGTNFRSSEMRFYNNGAIAHFGADNGFGTVPAPGVWHHIGVTYDGSTEVVYVDGIASTTVLLRTLDLWPSQPVFLGRAYTNADGSGSMYPWMGSMAALQVYGFAMAATDVATLAAQVPPDAFLYTIAASAATGGTISPSGAVTLLPGDSKTFTIGSTLGYAVSNVVVDTVSKGPITSYTFTNVTANHAISVETVVVPLSTISGTVRDKDGVGIGSASVYFSGTPNASLTPILTATTNPDGTYTQANIPQGTVYVSAGNVAGKWNSPDRVVVLGPSTATGVDFKLLSTTRNIPTTTDLLFSALTDTFPSTNGAATGSWANYLPADPQTLPVPTPLGPFVVISSPTVEYVDNIKWEQNQNILNNLDGYRVMGPLTNWPNTPAGAIPCNGATIVVVARPVRDGTTNYGSLVNMFRQNLVLGVHDGTGVVYVWRNASNINNRIPNGSPLVPTPYAIPDRQKTVLSLVVQSAGDFKVYANGALIYDVSSILQNGYGAFTAFVPNQQGTESSKKYINIGRHNADLDKTFNGNIGDVFVYKTALSDADRQTLETDLKTKFGIVTHAITTTVGANGAMTPTGNPPGNVIVTEGANMTFTITPGVGYAIDDVLVDGVSNPGAVAAGSYTFNNVIADHTISASFKIITFTITASAGANGSIDPTGAVSVDYGTNKTFIITPDGGYAIDDVLVDGVSDPGAVAAGSYTFTNVIAAGHTISATFKSAAKPVGVNNKAALTDDKLVGRLVKVWGKVMSIGATSFEISDGYTSNVTVNIGSATLPDGFDTTKTAVVTGVMNADKSVQAQAISAVP